MASACHGQMRLNFKLLWMNTFPLDSEDLVSSIVDSREVVEEHWCKARDNRLKVEAQYKSLDRYVGIILSGCGEAPARFAGAPRPRPED